jgi:hypothetical protein
VSSSAIVLAWEVVSDYDWKCTWRARGSFDSTQLFSTVERVFQTFLKGWIFSLRNKCSSS